MQRPAAAQSQLQYVTLWIYKDLRSFSMNRQVRRQGSPKARKPPANPLTSYFLTFMYFQGSPCPAVQANTHTHLLTPAVPRLQCTSRSHTHSPGSS